MKLKLFAALGLFVMAASTQAANVSINDITVMPGTSTVDVPVLITPTGSETIGSATISFRADGIPILASGDEFDGSIWESAPSGYFGFASTPSLGPNHNVASIASVQGPSGTAISPDGILITYRLNLMDLAPGLYSLDPNYLDGSSLTDGFIQPVDIESFRAGTLAVIPEPSTIALTAIFGALGLGVYFKRRRG